MKAPAGILQGVDGHLLLAYVNLDMLAADVKLVSNQNYIATIHRTYITAT